MNYSRQRAAVKENVLSRADHPTAADVFDSLRNSNADISLATVYRNLAILKESGEISSFSVGGTEHFDHNTENHLHFICRKCGRISDFNSECSDIITQAVAAGSCGAKVEEITVMATGLCGRCNDGKN